MSNSQIADEYVELIRLSQLNEKEAFLMALEVASIIAVSYSYKHDTKKGIPLLNELNIVFEKFKDFVEDKPVKPPVLVSDE